MNELWANIFGAVGALLLLGVVIFIMPYAVIWSLNVLFALSIPFTFQTWIAMAIILVITYRTKSSE